MYQKDSETDGIAGNVKRKLKFEDLQKQHGGRYVCSAILAFNSSRVERAFVLTVEGMLITQLFSIYLINLIYELPIINIFTSDDNSLSDPKLIVGENTFKESTVYLRVNETYDITCKGDTEQVDWKGPPNGWKIPDDVPQTYGFVVFFS